MCFYITTNPDSIFVHYIRFFLVTCRLYCLSGDSAKDRLPSKVWVDHADITTSSAGKKAKKEPVQFPLDLLPASHIYKKYRSGELNPTCSKLTFVSWPSGHRPV